MTVEISS